MRPIIALPLLGLPILLSLSTHAAPAPTPGPSPSGAIFSRDVAGQTLVIEGPQPKPTDPPTRRSESWTGLERRQIHNADFGASPQNRTLSDLSPSAAPQSMKKREERIFRRLVGPIAGNLPTAPAGPAAPNSPPLPVGGVAPNLPPVSPGGSSPSTPDPSPNENPEGSGERDEDPAPGTPAGDGPGAPSGPSPPHPPALPNANPFQVVSSGVGSTPRLLGAANGLYYGTPVSSVDTNKLSSGGSGAQDQAPPDPSGHPTP